MEAAGAVDMWSRSVDLHKAQYVEFIGDGDCSSYRDVVRSAPYGADVSIEKVECVGHIQKRMGGRLRKKKGTSKARGLVMERQLGGRTI